MKVSWIPQRLHILIFYHKFRGVNSDGPLLYLYVLDFCDLMYCEADLVMLYIGLARSSAFLSRLLSYTHQGASAFQQLN